MPELNDLQARRVLGSKVTLAKDLSDILPKGTQGRIKEAYQDIYLVDFEAMAIPVTIFENELEAG